MRWKKLTAMLLNLALMLSLAPAFTSVARAETAQVTVRCSSQGGFDQGGTVQHGDRTTSTQDTNTYSVGSKVTLTAYPADGYRLGCWYEVESGWIFGEENSNSVTVTVNSENSKNDYRAYFYPTNTKLTAAWIGNEVTGSGSSYACDFGTAGVGYDNGSYRRNLNIKNTTSNAVNIPLAPEYNTFVTLTGANPNAFEVNLSGVRAGRGWIDPGCCMSNDLIIYPASGLGAGTYTATMTLVEVCSQALAAPLTCTLSFTVRDDKVLSMAASPAEGGTVTRSPEGTTVSEGVFAYPKNTQVTLTAAANDGYKFQAWSDGATTNPRTVMMENNVTLTANFVTTHATVSVSCYKFQKSGEAEPGGGTVQIGSGSASTNPSATCEVGSEVTLTATPDSGYRFAYWESRKDGSVLGVEKNSSITVAVQDGGVELGNAYYAHFAPLDASMSAVWYDDSVGSSGSISSYDFGTWRVGYSNYGWEIMHFFYLKNTSTDDVRLAPQFDPFVRFSGKNPEAFCASTHNLSGGSLAPGESTGNGLLVYPAAGLPAGVYTATMTLVETWTPGLSELLACELRFTVTDDYVISTAVKNNVGGTVTGAGTYAYNSTVTLTATPEENYVFDHWERGNSTSTANPLTFKATKSETVTAVFRRSNYVISVAVDPAEGGTVTKNGAAFTLGSASYPSGTTLKLTAVPSADYVFSHWTDNGSTKQPDTGTTATITVSATIDHKLVAHFIVSQTALSGDLEGGKLKATVAAPAGSLLIAASYDGSGRQVDIKVFEITTAMNGTHTFDDLKTGNGYTYKLMLVDGATYAPLCNAWSG